MDTTALRARLAGYDTMASDLEDWVTASDVRELLDEIDALRRRVAELEAERAMITYIAIETAEHPDVMKRVLNDALREARRKHAPTGDGEVT